MLIMYVPTYQMSPRDHDVKNKFVMTCWSYLANNFSKFTPTNKMRISLEIVKKNMPQEILGQVNVTQMPLIQVDGKPLEANVGEPAVRVAEHIANAGQIETDTDGDK